MPDFPPQPENSKISFLPTPTSLTFLIPRTGFKGAALVFVILAVVWCSITGFIFLVFLFASFGDRNAFFLLPLIFLALFGLLGIFMFLAALQLAFRKAVIIATAEALLYEQSGPIRKKRELQWPANTLAAIRTDFSGTTINNVRLRELKIITTTGQSNGFFDGRPNPELDWLAATLSNFYNLTPLASTE